MLHAQLEMQHVLCADVTPWAMWLERGELPTKNFPKSTRLFIVDAGTPMPAHSREVRGNINFVQFDVVSLLDVTQCTNVATNVATKLFQCIVCPTVCHVAGMPNNRDLDVIISVRYELLTIGETGTMTILWTTAYVPNHGSH
jgi:hypothetical protein